MLPALAGVAQLVGVSSHNQKVVGLIPSLRAYGRQPIIASRLSTLSISLKAKKKKKVLGED